MSTKLRTACAFAASLACAPVPVLAQDAARKYVRIASQELAPGGVA